ncbi:MAG: hypothetical protein PHT95_06690, partial [Candidatus Omnitrophica bacterium]|nr:hypothetical protein [Candidatus Omnitrophota bacterium]
MAVSDEGRVEGILYMLYKKTPLDAGIAFVEIAPWNREGVDRRYRGVGAELRAFGIRGLLSRDPGLSPLTCILAEMLGHRSAKSNIFPEAEKISKKAMWEYCKSQEVLRKRLIADFGMAMRPDEQDGGSVRSLSEIEDILYIATRSINARIDQEVRSAVSGAEEIFTVSPDIWGEFREMFREISALLNESGGQEERAGSTFDMPRFLALLQKELLKSHRSLMFRQSAVMHEGKLIVNMPFLSLHRIIRTLQVTDSDVRGENVRAEVLFSDKTIIPDYWTDRGGPGIQPVAAASVLNTAGNARILVDIRGAAFRLGHCYGLRQRIDSDGQLPFGEQTGSDAADDALQQLLCRQWPEADMCRDEFTTVNLWPYVRAKIMSELCRGTTGNETAEIIPYALEMGRTSYHWLKIFSLLWYEFLVAPKSYLDFVTGRYFLENFFPNVIQDINAASIKGVSEETYHFACQGFRDEVITTIPHLPEGAIKEHALMLVEGLALTAEDEFHDTDGGNARPTEKEAWRQYLYLWERVVAVFGLERKTGIYLLAGGDFVPLAALTAGKKAYTGKIISVNLDEDSRGNDITPETMKDAASQTAGALRNGISELFDSEYISKDKSIRCFGPFINIAVDAREVGVIKEKLARLKENGYLNDEKPDYLVLKGLGWLDLSGSLDIKEYVADLLRSIVKKDGLIIVWTLPMVEAYGKVGDRIVRVDMTRISSTDRKVTDYAKEKLRSVGMFTSRGCVWTGEVIWAGEHGRMVLPAFSVKIYRNAPPNADGKEHLDGGWKDRLPGRAYAERMSIRARWAWIHAARFFIPAFIAGAPFFPYFVLSGAAYAADFVVVLAGYILAISYPGLLASFVAITGPGGLNLNAGQKTKGVRQALLVSVLIGGFFVFIGYTGAVVSPSALGMLKIVSVILLFIYITPHIPIPRAFVFIPYWMMPLAFPLIAGPALLVNTFVSLQLYGAYLTVVALSAGMVITYFVLDLVKNWEAEEIEKKRQKLYYRVIEAFGYGYLYLLMVYSLNSAAKDLGIWNEHMLEYEYILLAVVAAVYAVYKIVSRKRDKRAAKETTDWEGTDKDGGIQDDTVKRDNDGELPVGL